MLDLISKETGMTGPSVPNLHDLKLGHAFYGTGSVAQHQAGSPWNHTRYSGPNPLALVQRAGRQGKRPQLRPHPVGLACSEKAQGVEHE